MSRGTQHNFLNTHILTNDAQELTPYRFELKTDANRIRKEFVYSEGLEPGSLRLTTNALVKSAMQAL